jgi:Cytochrome c oxidase subunit IV
MACYGRDGHESVSLDVQFTALQSLSSRTAVAKYQANWNSILAWWIAFGPHGPRAETPPGEWGQVFLYSAIGCAISVALFMFIHSFARPPPRTMTKEWQEATNEYLKVGFNPDGRLIVETIATVTDEALCCRKKDPTLSTVLAVRDIAERVMYRASRRKSSENELENKNSISREERERVILLATSAARGFSMVSICLNCRYLMKAGATAAPITCHLYL